MKRQRGTILFGVIFVACVVAIVVGYLTREVYINTVTPTTNTVLRAANVSGNTPCRIRTVDGGTVQLPGAFQVPTKRVREYSQRVNASVRGAESCVVSMHDTDIARCAKGSSIANNRFDDAIVRDLRVVPSSSDMDGNDLECLVSFHPMPRAARVRAYAAKIDPDAMNVANMDLTRRLDNAQNQVAQLMRRSILIPRERASSVLTQSIHYSMRGPTFVHYISISGFPSIQANLPGRNIYVITVNDGSRVVKRHSITVNNLSQLNLENISVSSRMTRLSIVNTSSINFNHRFTAFTNAQLDAVQIRAFT